MKKFSAMILLIAYLTVFIANGLGFKSVANAAEDIPAPTDITKRFPVFQAAVNKVISGNVRGFGMLAQYDAPGPSEIYARRITSQKANEPYVPVCYVKVFDPNGYTVAYYDFTDQPSGASTVIKVPAGIKGNWRVAFSGGRDGDRLEIGLPQTSIWGVRGEMSLGITETLPTTNYIYTPIITHSTPIPDDMPRYGYFSLELLGGVKSNPELFDETGKSLGSPTTDKGRKLLVIDSIPKNEVWKLEMNGQPGGALVIFGVPGFLCPTKEAAEALKGGTVESDGFTLAGPLQAKMRHRMIELYQQNPTNYTVDFPTEVPIDLIEPRLEVLNYAKFGALNDFGYLIKTQVLDPNNPYFGAVYSPKSTSNWHADTFATAVTQPGLMNPAYGNKALINRTVLSAFCTMVNISGDDMMIKDHVYSTAISGAFFAHYDAQISRLYTMLKAWIDPETSELWRQMLINIADKSADFQSWESNQYAHVSLGHLHAYLGTGEKRFLGYYEKMMTALMKGTFGPNAVYGIHPAGYFMEDRGPDGNYDNLSSYCLAVGYMLYGKLKEGNPEFLQLMKDTINKNLTWKSFYWMEQPRKGLAAPNHMSTRKTASMIQGGYPSEFMTPFDNPLSLKRIALHVAIPLERRVAASNTFPHNAYTNDAATQVLKQTISKKENAYDAAGGSWTASLTEAYSREITVKPATLPTECDSGTWELPGQIAWKRGPIYGLIFYDVAGMTYDFTNGGLYGGGPSALWSKGTGLVEKSTKIGDHPSIKGPNDVVHSCVFGTGGDGNFFYSGKEHSTFNWIEKDHIFEITSSMKKTAGEVKWRYQIENDKTVITVSLKTDQPAKETFVNIPLWISYDDAKFTVQDNSVTFGLDNSEMKFTWTKGIAGQLGDKGKESMRNLRIPISTDGKPVEIVVTAK